MRTEVKISVQTSNQESRDWYLPEEVPVALIYQNLSYAIMLCTPQDLRDFALGFSLSERIISKPDQLLDLEISERKQGIELRMQIDAQRFESLSLLVSRRNVPGRSCGACGMDNETEFFEVLKPARDTPTILQDDVVSHALTQFDAQQLLKRSNKSVHGAAWVHTQGEHAGEISALREDVGRHNALDKLIGALMVKQTNVEEGFLLISSRCSYDILLKSARIGIPAIVSLSAPTAFALRKAQEARISLYTASRDDLVKITP